MSPQTGACEESIAIVVDRQAAEVPIRTRYERVGSWTATVCKHAAARIARWGR